MQSFPPTFILRHRKENLKKCSLRGLEKRDDCIFLKYPRDPLPILTNYIVLALDAPPLTLDDQSRGLLLLDGTWKYAAKMLSWVENQQVLEKRSIPTHFQTAYPRCQEDSRGLASIEALYIAYELLGRDTSNLLQDYYWKDLFLMKNPCLRKLT